MNLLVHVTYGMSKVFQGTDLLIADESVQLCTVMPDPLACSPSFTWLTPAHAPRLTCPPFFLQQLPVEHLLHARCSYAVGCDGK